MRTRFRQHYAQRGGALALLVCALLLTGCQISVRRPSAIRSLAAVSQSDTTATQLIYSVEPSLTGTAGTVLAQQPVVEIRSASNTLITSATDVVTLAAYSDNTCTSAIVGGVYTGEVVTAVGGKATFTSLSFTTAGVTYFKATSGALTSACSTIVTIAADTAAAWTFTTQPSIMSLAIRDFFTMPVLEIQDQYGNTATSAATAATITAYSTADCSTTAAPGAITKVSTTTNGVATFTTLKYSLPGWVYLKASGGGLTTACSNRVVMADGRMGGMAGNMCRIEGNQTVKCAGKNSFYGYLGNGTTDSSQSFVPVLGLTNVMQVFTGATDSCAVKSDGTIWCWGRSYGLTPVDMGYSDVAFATVGYGGWGCYLNKADWKVYCWPPGGGLATLVPGLSNVAIISGSGYNSLSALLADGSYYEWSYWSPPPVLNASGAGSFGVDRGATMCILVGDTGQVKCASTISAYGSIGDGTTTTNANFQATKVLAGGADLTGAIQVTADSYHACALLSDQTVKCWGRNEDGALGDGTKINRLKAVPVAGLGGPVQSIVAKDGHTCALLTNGTFQCWGTGGFGEMGNSTKIYYKAGTDILSGYTGVSQIAASVAHMCFIADPGATLYCVGNNIDGLLGDGTTISKDTPVSTGINGAVSVAVGAQHTCVVTGAGVVKCWGRNVYGQLGQGSWDWGIHSTPLTVTPAGGRTGVQVVSGYLHVCLLVDDGTVQCWGYNWAGQIGNGTLIDQLSPVTVGGLAGVTAIAASVVPTNTDPAFPVGGGGDSTCALLAGGVGVKCWGYNGYMNLGDTTTTNRTTPVSVDSMPPAGRTVSAITMGSRHSCALLDNGTAQCWGDNTHGALGAPGATYFGSPVDVTGVTTATAIAAGAEHTCVRLANGTVQCTGWNSTGALGDTTFTQRTAMVAVSGVATSTAIFAGYLSSFSLSTGGATEVQAWGCNGSAVLGLGAGEIFQTAPVTAP